MPTSSERPDIDTGPAVDDWDRHWSDFSDASQQNPAVAYRVRILRDRLRPLIGDTHCTVLDIGSGIGDLAVELGHEFPRATIRGIELSESGVAVSRVRAPHGEFLQFDLLGADPIPDSWKCATDVAVCSEVLEHLDDPATFLRNAAKLLVPGCVVLVTVPAGPMSAFDRHIGHRQHFTPASLEALLRSAGFVPIDTVRAGFPFFNLYRMMVLARGHRLVSDAASLSRGTGRIMGAVSAVFKTLFRCNLARSLWGWQLMSVATWGGASDEAAS